VYREEISRHRRFSPSRVFCPASDGVPAHSVTPPPGHVASHFARMRWLKSCFIGSVS
jgi:hypothetical protein